MKFTLAAASTFITAALAATLPKSFTLVADGGNTVLTDNSIEDGKTITFTQQQAVNPNSWQNLYAIAGKSKPLGLTIPHSGATPDGAVLNGWGITDDGYLTFNGENNFGLSEDKHQIYFLGEDATVPKVTLWVKELK
ncbi:unnamed protein product [Aspergillus oryzae]|nr:unnamed protein product [Aspergillus oryzae]GMF83767.1 unnamed protein product [Aspergillus oryzae]GMG06114.1 unnamed protein product [Aspergillus oryzae]GMG55384.1 unnamed protein product [Aspergillus oryzae var. brunneus]